MFVVDAAIRCYAAFPQGTAKDALLHSLVGLTVGCLLTRNVTYGCMTNVVMLGSSLVYSASAPIFKNYVWKKDVETSAQFVFRHFCALVASFGIISALLPNTLAQSTVTTGICTAALVVVCAAKGFPEIPFPE